MLAACSGAQGDQTIDITHDPCAGTTLGGGETDTQRTGIDDAIALWASEGAQLSRVDASRSGAPMISVVFEPAAGAFHGVYDDEHGVIHINDDLVDPTQLAIVIAHEMGHAFGLVHVTDRTSLMNPGNLSTPPTDEDRLAVEALWGDCQPPNP